MDLEAYQRSLLALCFGPLRDSPLSIYRDMVRSRLLAMARVAYHGAFALSERELRERFERYLDASPPRTPLIREYIGDFAQAADDLPPPLSALVHFGAAKWRAANALDASHHALRELDFDGALALNGTLQVAELACTVLDGDGRELAEPLAAAQAVLVYRRPEQDDVRWFASDPLLARVLRLAQLRPASLSTLVPVAVDQLGMVADAGLLQRLVSALTLAVERRVVLGVSGVTS